MNSVAKDTIRNQRLGMSVYDAKTGEAANVDQPPLKLLAATQLESSLDNPTAFFLGSDRNALATW